MTALTMWMGRSPFQPVDLLVQAFDRGERTPQAFLPARQRRSFAFQLAAQLQKPALAFRVIEMMVRPHDAAPRCGHAPSWICSFTEPSPSCCSVTV
jgi:hypothetical protein